MIEQGVALVAGANKGTGFAIARGLLEQGLVVYLGARGAARGERAAAALDGRARRPGEQRGHRRVGTPPPGQTTVQDMRETYETNVFGVVAVTNAMLPLPRRSRAGRIVNLTSDLGSLANAASDSSFPQLLAYNSSKAALNAVTITMANELRDQGILVNAVSSGSVATDQNGHRGVLTPDQGAKLPIRMATLPVDGPTAIAVTADNEMTQHPCPGSDTQSGPASVVRAQQASRGRWSRPWNATAAACRGGADSEGRRRG